MDLKTHLRKLIWQASPDFYWKAVRRRQGQTFSIGVLRGKSPFDLSPVGRDSRPILTPDDINDLPASFVADPFMIQVDGTWYMFFEILNSITRQGEIGFATSRDGVEWAYQKSVLSEDFHLAYPFVFTWHDSIYMVPDSPGNGVRLYRAHRFPDEWVFVCELKNYDSFSDTSLLNHDDHWWMFTTWRGPQEDTEALRLFHAHAPIGPWTEHPCSPIVTHDLTRSRAAGRPLQINGRIYRFAQDCSRVYGESVSAFEVTNLTVSSYQEEKLGKPVLQPGGTNWNQDGMHHIDAHRLKDDSWIACVDGWYMANGER